ncbi:hypothetical protein Taro_025003 [Colocasia esculenta]|uniref:Uncharacterized protein n=1 Tax=Colocasia esculenta TaxID=4460 RepID=A0A843VCX4_COLES|nr:hypothetical protein [Colocasia esculenta]
MMKKWSSGVDTGSSSVDTRSSSQKTCLAVLDRIHDRASQDHSGKRRFERERGICIQRSRAAPPKGEEGEEEGEEEEKLEIARVLI